MLRCSASRALLLLIVLVAQGFVLTNSIFVCCVHVVLLVIMNISNFICMVFVFAFGDFLLSLFLLVCDLCLQCCSWSCFNFSCHVVVCLFVCLFVRSRVCSLGCFCVCILVWSLFVFVGFRFVSALRCRVSLCLCLRSLCYCNMYLLLFTYLSTCLLIKILICLFKYLNT